MLRVLKDTNPNEGGMYAIQLENDEFFFVTKQASIGDISCYEQDFTKGNRNFTIADYNDFGEEGVSYADLVDVGEVFTTFEEAYHYILTIQLVEK